MMVVPMRRRIQNTVQTIWTHALQQCQHKVHNHQWLQRTKKPFSARWAIPDLPQPGSMLHGLMLYTHRHLLDATHLHQHWCLVRPFIGMGVRVGPHGEGKLFVVESIVYSTQPEWTKDIVRMDPSLRLKCTLRSSDMSSSSSSSCITIRLNVVDTLMLGCEESHVPAQQLFSSPYTPSQSCTLQLEWTGMKLEKTLEHPCLLLVGPFQIPTTTHQPRTIPTPYILSFMQTARGRLLFSSDWNGWIQSLLMQHISSSHITFYLRVKSVGSTRLLTLLSCEAFAYARLRKQARRILRALQLHPDSVDFPSSPFSPSSVDLSSLHISPSPSSSSSSSNHWITTMKQAFTLTQPTLASLQVTRIQKDEVSFDSMTTTSSTSVSTQLNCQWGGLWTEESQSHVNLKPIPTYVQRILSRDWITTFILDHTLSKNTLVLTTPWTRGLWEHTLHQQYPEVATAYNIQCYPIRHHCRRLIDQSFTTLVLHGDHLEFGTVRTMLQELSFSRLVILTTNWVHSLSPLLMMTRAAAFDPRSSLDIKTETQALFKQHCVGGPLNVPPRAQPQVHLVSWGESKASKAWYTLYRQCLKTLLWSGLPILAECAIHLCHGLPISYTEEELASFDKTTHDYLTLPEAKYPSFQNVECPICFKDVHINTSIDVLKTFMRPVYTPCHHAMCWSCLKQWWQINRASKCPVCRFDCSFQMYRPPLTSASLSPLAFSPSTFLPPKLAALKKFCCSSSSSSSSGISRLVLLHTSPSTIAWYAHTLSNCKGVVTHTVQDLSTLSSAYTFLLESPSSSSSSPHQNTHTRLLITSL